MPNILALTDKETGERHEGRGLIEVDEKLCKALGVPVDPVTFYLGWVDWMILYLVNDWDKVKAEYTPENYKDGDWLAKRIAVIDWLSSHYDLDGYAVIGRH